MSSDDVYDWSHYDERDRLKQEKDRKILLDNKYGEIYNTPYFEDLRQVIRTDGNLDEFLAQRRQRLHEEYIADRSAPILQQKHDCENKIAEINASISETRALNLQLDEFEKDIQRLVAAYPKDRQRNIQWMLTDYVGKGRFDPSYLERLSQKPTGLVNKLRQGGRIKQANRELEAFVEKYSRSDIVSKTSALAQNDEMAYSYGSRNLKMKLEAIAARDPQRVEYETREFEEKIASGAEQASYYQKEVIKADQRLGGLEENWQKSPYFAKEEEIIRQFVEDKKDYIVNPPTIDEETVRTKGLTEDYIEGQICQSRHPEKVRRSIRRFYEGLDRPAAPVVAFSERGVVGGAGDKIMEEMRKKGLEVVAQTDPRAVNPDVFVVDKEERCIYAPFLAPEDALKANTMMIDAIYDSGGEASLSNPRSREALVWATDRPLHNNADTDNMLLDLETVAKSQPGNRYDEVMKNFAKEYTASVDYAKLTGLVKQMQADNPEGCNKIIMDVRNQAAPFIANGGWTAEAADKIAKNVADKYADELFPYIKKEYQETMLQEAAAKGIDAAAPNAANQISLDRDGVLTSVFHAGQNGGKPYSILAREKRMSFTYAASHVGHSVLDINGKEYWPTGCLGYAFGQSTHNAKQYGGRKFGFVYEYESRGAKQEFLFLDAGASVTDNEVAKFTGGKFSYERLSGASDETAVMAHQNKLKKIYIAVEDNKQGYVMHKIFPLELDENGEVKDKRWRDFLELHNPVDDNLKGNMVERRNNVITQYDELGESQMWRKLNVRADEKANANAAANVGKETAPEAVRSSAAVEENIEKTAGKAAEKTVGRTAEKAVSSSGSIAASIKKADDRVNTAIDKTIEKGSNKLNNSWLGRQYDKISQKISNTKVVKAINKVGEKIGQTAVVKSVKKTMEKTAGKIASKAVGKSLLKKIPVVSAAAGVYFAYERIKEGDWKGACGEVASGALGCFPGLGTAASVAVDATLAGRDIYNASADDKKETQIKTEEVVHAPTAEPKNAARQTGEQVKSAVVSNMRAKLAAGHESTVPEAEQRSSVAERLHALRYDSSHRVSGTVTPTRVSEKAIEKAMQRQNA